MMDGLRYRPAITPVGIELLVTQELTDMSARSLRFSAFQKS
jgi:hypothetical protein